MSDAANHEAAKAELNRIKVATEKAKTALQKLHAEIKTANDVAANVAAKCEEIMDETVKIQPNKKRWTIGPFRPSSFIAAIISLILLCVSAYFAYVSRVETWKDHGREYLCYLIVGAWALGPPIYFWADWILFAGNIKGEE